MTHARSRWDSTPSVVGGRPDLRVCYAGEVVGYSAVAATVDGLFSGIGTPASGTTVVVRVAGRAGLPSSVDSVALNVTVDDATAPGFVTAYPCDGARPSTSNLNYAAGQTIANAVMTAVSLLCDHSATGPAGSVDHVCDHVGQREQLRQSINVGHCHRQGVAV